MIKKYFILLFFLIPILLPGRSFNNVPALGARYINFPTGFYPEKWAFNFALFQGEIDDAGGFTELFKLFDIAAICQVNKTKDDIWKFSASLFEYKKFYEYSLLKVSLFTLDMTGFAKTYGEAAKIAFGFASGNGSDNIIGITLIPSIAYCSFGPEREFYKNFILFDNTDVNGMEFGIENELFVNTGLLNLGIKNEFQALAGNEPLFFYKLCGSADINLGDFSQPGDVKYKLSAIYKHERAFLDNYKQFNDSFSLALMFFFE